MIVSAGDCMSILETEEAGVVVVKAVETVATILVLDACGVAAVVLERSDTG